MPPLSLRIVGVLTLSQGRVLHTVFCIPSKPNTYLISHESGADHPAPLAQLLPPFRLRAKIRIKDVSDEWDVWSAWGSEVDSSPPTSTWRFGSGGAAERLWTWEGKRAALGLAESEVGCWDLRAGWGEGGMGRQVFVPKGQRRESRRGTETILTWALRRTEVATTGADKQQASPRRMTWPRRTSTT